MVGFLVLLMRCVVRLRISCCFDGFVFVVGGSCILRFCGFVIWLLSVRRLILVLGVLIWYSAAWVLLVRVCWCLAAWCFGFVWSLCGFGGMFRVTLLRCFACICFGGFGGCWSGWWWFCVFGYFGLVCCWFLGCVGGLVAFAGFVVVVCFGGCFLWFGL